MNCMKPIFFLLCCLLLAMSGCTDSTADTPAATPFTIDIQPFTDADTALVKQVTACLKKIYPNVELKPAIPIPPMAYYKARKRYRADSLLAFLNKRQQPGHLAIALTSKDISWTKGTVPDYGIMGLGLCPGNACVASSFRLSKTNTADQLFKIAIHELGHTQGLVHCPNPSCYMRDAKGKNHTNELHGFCQTCKQRLLSKGWAL